MIARKAEVQPTPTPWALHESPNDYEGKLIQAHDRVVAVVFIKDAVKSSPEEEANARLIVAAVNAFGSAARRLGLSPVEWAERMGKGGLAGLVEAAKAGLALAEVAADYSGEKADRDVVLWLRSEIEKVQGVIP
ncbi:MAG: hypothetical protein HY548_09325 [Elusimicrobia bacterium]|nr:hypothetical protein [Elusimicrobiota bacterium]